MNSKSTLHTHFFRFLWLFTIATSIHLLTTSFVNPSFSNFTEEEPKTTEQFLTEGTIKTQELNVLLPFSYKPQKIKVQTVGNTHILEGDIVISQEDILSDQKMQQFNLPQIHDHSSHTGKCGIEKLEQVFRHITDRSGNLFDMPDIKQQAVAIRGRYYRWPNGIIPFSISHNFSPAKMTAIMDAINHINRHTNIQLVRRTNETAYVVFVNKNGCWSQIGRSGRRQEISIGPGCDFDSIVHEICHSIGLWHEQSRSDRDNYIDVQWHNIQTGQGHNFEKHITDGVDIGSYDYQSIMHYSSYAFSANGHPTMVSKTNQAIRRNNRLSKGDIAAINALYPKSTPPAPTSPPVTTNPPPRPTTPAVATKIGASVNRGDGKAYFFKNDEYLRFNQYINRPELGYPKQIDGNWRGISWTTVDAAVNWGNGKIYLFKDDQYARYDVTSAYIDPGYPKPIYKNWGGLHRGMNWDNLDAAVAWNTGKVYFFKGNQYVRYDTNKHQVDPGYPKAIQGNWGDFTWTNIDAAINWNDEKTYFFRDNQYVRYDMQTGRVDAGYPKPIQGNWVGL